MLSFVLQRIGILGFLCRKDVLNPMQNKGGKKLQIPIFMLRLPPTFPTRDVLGVISGKALCTPETPVFTQHETVSEVREGME